MLCAVWISGLAFLSFCPANQAQDAQSSTPQQPPPVVFGLATKIGNDIKSGHFRRIAVIGGFGPGAQVSELGDSLANELSEVLVAQHDAFSIVDRADLRTFLRHQRVGLLMLESDIIADWIAEGVKADGYVVAHIVSINGNEAVVTADLFEEHEDEGRLVATEQVNLPLDDAAVKAASEGLPKVSLSSDGMAATTGTDKRASLPTCEYCPRPEYSRAAKAKRLERPVTLSMIVTAKGEASEITVVKPAGSGLDGRAIEAVQRWRFNPATDSKGTPVAIRINVE